jgi:hypothetical protein
MIHTARLAIDGASPRRLSGVQVTRRFERTDVRGGVWTAAAGRA